MAVGCLLCCVQTSLQASICHRFSCPSLLVDFTVYYCVYCSSFSACFLVCVCHCALSPPAPLSACSPAFPACCLFILCMHLNLKASSFFLASPDIFSSATSPLPGLPALVPASLSALPILRFASLQHNIHTILSICLSVCLSVWCPQPLQSRRGHCSAAASGCSLESSERRTRCATRRMRSAPILPLAITLQRHIYAIHGCLSCYIHLEAVKLFTASAENRHMLSSGLCVGLPSEATLRLLEEGEMSYGGIISVLLIILLLPCCCCCR